VKEKEGAVTLEDGRTTRVMRLLRRSPLTVAGAALGLLAVLGLSIFGAMRVTRRSSAAEQTPTEHLASPRPETSVPTQANSADNVEADAPVLMDLPPTPNGDKRAPRTHGAKSNTSKPQRPKFLNSRE
jgi:hypothetical protein